MVETAAQFAPHIVGLFGILIFAAADALQSLHRIKSTGIAYWSLCVLAAALVVAGLLTEFSFAVLLVELFVLTTCMLAVGVQARRRDAKEKGVQARRRDAKEKGVQARRRDAKEKGAGAQTTYEVRFP